METLPIELLGEIVLRLDLSDYASLLRSSTWLLDRLSRPELVSNVLRPNFNHCMREAASLNDLCLYTLFLDRSAGREIGYKTRFISYCHFASWNNQTALNLFGDDPGGYTEQIRSFYSCLNSLKSIYSTWSPFFQWYALDLMTTIQDWRDRSPSGSKTHRELRLLKTIKRHLISDLIRLPIQTIGDLLTCFLINRYNDAINSDSSFLVLILEELIKQSRYDDAILLEERTERIDREGPFLLFLAYEICTVEELDEFSKYYDLLKDWRRYIVQVDTRWLCSLGDERTLRMVLEIIDDNNERFRLIEGSIERIAAHHLLGVVDDLLDADDDTKDLIKLIRESSHDE